MAGGDAPHMIFVESPLDAGAVVALAVLDPQMSSDPSEKSTEESWEVVSGGTPYLQPSLGSMVVQTQLPRGTRWDARASERPSSLDKLQG